MIDYEKCAAFHGAYRGFIESFKNVRLLELDFYCNWKKVVASDS